MRLSSIIITALCICLSFMSCACSSSQQANEQADRHGFQLTPPVLMPRKLKVTEEAMVKGSGKKDNVVFEPVMNKQYEGLSGKSSDDGNQESNRIQEKNKEWNNNEARESDLFTMDYRPVKRRRPVHNKSVPTSSSIDAP